MYPFCYKNYSYIQLKILCCHRPQNYNFVSCGLKFMIPVAINSLNLLQQILLKVQCFERKNLFLLNSSVNSKPIIFGDNYSKHLLPENRKKKPHNSLHRSDSTNFIPRHIRNSFDTKRKDRMSDQYCLLMEIPTLYACLHSREFLELHITQTAT